MCTTYCENPETLTFLCFCILCRRKTTQSFSPTFRYSILRILSPQIEISLNSHKWKSYFQKQKSMTFFSFFGWLKSLDSHVPLSFVLNPVKLLSFSSPNARYEALNYSQKKVHRWNSSEKKCTFLSDDNRQLKK